MHQMIELHPKPDALDVLGLPAIPYPVALPVFQAAVANDGEPPLADMLLGLQLRAADARADWQRMEPAMARLAELLAGDDMRERIPLECAPWLEVAPVEPDRAALALVRGDLALAALSFEEGRWQVAACRPLDAGALRLLHALPRDPATAGSLATCADADPAVDPGATCFVRWSPGLAADAPATRRAACVSAEIRTFVRLGGAAG
ncbi:hypothetical protein [Luteimonas sp. MC1895]|uniref:hypothetical protein n=1 Tax=Luteimonas sp. MC1895 TaxID=2819513 RepID=UPI0018F097BE|nr:hypothetical protein [Luteimonas sp. MC1895]MBJ6978351.1 hypothetical protein [Luteimonas sp. MC1895]